MLGANVAISANPIEETRMHLLRVKGFLCLAVALLLATSALAAPFDPQRLAMLDQALQAEVEQGRLAGIALLIERDGEQVYRREVGYQDLASQTPLAEDSLYKIFSLTKPVTAVAVLMLVEEGKLALDQAVEHYLPEFKDLQVAIADGEDGRPVTEPASHPVTLRELMNYTGGFSYGRFSQSQVDTLYEQADLFSTDQTLAEMVAKVAALPLRQQPGTLWHYSISVDIQARIVEVVTGQPYAEFLAERIFQPLGMHETAYQVTPEQAPRLVTSYHPVAGEGLKPLPNDGYLLSPKLTMGGSGLISSMDDYLRFARMLLNEGELDGVRLLKPESVRMMASNQLPEGVAGPNWAPGNLFGLNVAVVNDPEPAGFLPVGTFWWWGIQGPWMWVDPSNDTVILGMMQNTDYRHSRVVHNTISQILYRQR
ncbi:serine hydrolase [Pseudomonas sp. WN033]|nr:serine hydrolase [Pseudomonas sp. WN033]